MLCFGLQKINRTFVLTEKRLNVLGDILFFACLVLNMLLLLFYRLHLFFCILTWKNIIRNLHLAFSLLLTFFTAFFEAFKR